MSSNDNAHDKQFFDTFMLVLGLLIGVSIALIFVSRAIAATTQHVVVAEDKAVVAAANQRLAPAGKVAVSGEDNSALEAPVAVTQAAAADLAGDEAYTMACAMCHTAGIAGAPKWGQGPWAPRIAQGMPTLYKHAIAGFQGRPVHACKGRPCGLLG